MSSYGSTERTAREEANEVIEWFFANHEMRALRCEQDVLNTLLAIEQVRRAVIDTGCGCIDYFTIDGTLDTSYSFPMGLTVGGIGFGLGWYCAQITNMDGDVLDPTCSVDEDDTVMVKENSRIIQAEEAREFAERIRLESGIVDLRTKCQCLADTETRMTIRVRERIAAGESNQRTDCFKRNVLFPIREAFLSCSAALHVSRGGDDSDLGQFSTLIREFMPNGQGFQGVVVDSAHQEEWMAVMTNALMKTHIFPSMQSKGEKRRKAKERRNGCAISFVQ